MKRRFLLGILVLVFGIFVVGCEKNDSKDSLKEKEAVKYTDKWSINTDGKSVKMSENTLKIFNKAAKKYTKSELEPIALLGISKNASFKNYMFLCKSTKDNVVSWKVVIVKNTNKNKASVQKTKMFDVESYFEKDRDAAKSTSYKINENMLSVVLNENVAKAFNNATKDSEIKYSPIQLLGVKDSKNKMYAVLSLGKKNNGKKTTYSLSVLTIEDNKGDAKIVNNAKFGLDELVK